MTYSQRLPGQLCQLSLAAALQETTLKALFKAFKEGREVVVMSGRRVGKTARQNALQAAIDRGPAGLPPEWAKTPQKG